MDGLLYAPNGNALIWYAIVHIPEIDISKENQPNYILFKTINFISQY